jgi:hypothetical protein
MSVGNNQGIVGGIRVDLQRLHETWMELLYPRQRGAADTVLGKWQPKSQGQRIAYRGWAALGMPVIGLLYPFVLFGAFLRFQTRRVDGTATRIGLLGVVGLSVFVWGGLTVLARYQLTLLDGGLVAVAAAGVAATLSAGLAVGARSAGGRSVTILFAYPFALTAIFLPPVVAALFSQAAASVIVPQSEALSIWFVDTVLTPVGVGQFFTSRFDIEGIAYAVVWTAGAFPLGWLFGVLVTLADFVRPTG